MRSKRANNVVNGEILNEIIFKLLYMASKLG